MLERIVILRRCTGKTCSQIELSGDRLTLSDIQVAHLPCVDSLTDMRVFRMSSLVLPSRSGYTAGIFQGLRTFTPPGLNVDRAH
jgi:hypothetical protein